MQPFESKNPIKRRRSESENLKATARCKVADTQPASGAAASRIEPMVADHPPMSELKKKAFRKSDPSWAR